MAEPGILLNDIVLGESPRWHADRLWFSDWGTGEVLAVDLAGRREVMARVSGLPFCIDWLPDGRLVIVSGRERRLLRMEPDGSLVPHADLAALAGPHAWNDLAVDGRGNAYVDNVGFDFPDGEVTTGVIAVVTPDGGTRLVADDLLFPNGMAVTPDDTTLIVAESYGSRLTAYDIDPDGGLSNRRVWAALDQAAPDGICLDAEGAVWYADVPNRCCVRVREGGDVLQRVQLDRGCFACALGGTDRPVLFMVAAQWSGPGGMMSGPRTGHVFTVEVPVAGVARG